MKKILVIDYDQSSLTSLQGILAKEGYQVVTAADGQAGWDKYNKESPDLVLLEAMLPKVHGFELCQRITSERNSQATVFIMTGVYKDRVYRTEALRTYGASEYFEKPLDMLKFIASIHAVLTVPDIKPGLEIKAKPEAKPGNGEPADEPGPVPVVKPVHEEPRRVEHRPERRRARESVPHRTPATGAGQAGEEGLTLESLLHVKASREEHVRTEAVPGLGSIDEILTKVKIAHDVKPAKEDEIRLETLLNLHPEKDDHRRTEPTELAFPDLEALKVPEEKHHEHAKKEAGAEAIDKLLETTLADFGLETEKKKAATAPQKPEPAPSYFPPASAQEQPKPATPPAMPAAVAERPKPPQAKSSPPTPAKAQPPARPKASPHPVPAAPAAPAPKAEARTEPKPLPQKAEKKETAHETEEKAEARIFKDIDEVDKKKNLAPFIAVGAGLVIVAVVAFFLLRPKPSADQAGAGHRNRTTMTQSSVPEKSPDMSLPSLSEEKLKAMNAKAKAQANQNRPAEVLPSAGEAIAPPQPADVSRLAVQVPAGKRPEAKPSESNPAGTKTPEAGSGDAKGAETQTSQVQDKPPANIEATPPQGTTAGGNDAGSQPDQAPKAKTGDLIDLAAADELPRVLKSVEPAYPAQALRFGKEGSVTINALIDESGNVTKTGILKGLKDDMGLEKAAEAAVRKWKFQPAKKDGVNVKVWKPIVITFKALRSKTT